jgi:hypothetical protein
MITTLTLLIILILIAIWNGMVINWKTAYNEDKALKISKQWHKVGLVIRFLIVALIAYTTLNVYWIVGSVLLSWFGYNIIINLVRGMKWYYLSDSGIDGIIKKLFNCK